MTGSVTTSFCTTAKQELATGGHCFLANVVSTLRTQRPLPLTSILSA